MLRKGQQKTGEGQGFIQACFFLGGGNLGRRKVDEEEKDGRGEQEGRRAQMVSGERRGNDTKGGE